MKNNYKDLFNVLTYNKKKLSPSFNKDGIDFYRMVVINNKIERYNEIFNGVISKKEIKKLILSCPLSDDRNFPLRNISIIANKIRHKYDDIYEYIGIYAINNGFCDLFVIDDLMNEKFKETKRIAVGLNTDISEFEVYEVDGYFLEGKSYIKLSETFNYEYYK
ncbi:MAG: hypothetical protein E6Q85_02750 [Thiothrix sp.]|nr:MAG: hypothetical protein E6Q85_02750 [Thiothrix sp.]